MNEENIKKSEKIEIGKNNGNFFLTGILQLDLEDENWVTIDTVKGEHLKFRKEQIMQRRRLYSKEIKRIIQNRTVDTDGDDTNGTKKGNKNL